MKIIGNRALDDAGKPIILNADELQQIARVLNLALDRMKRLCERAAERQTTEPS